jgi:hypothetical protein
MSEKESIAFAEWIAENHYRLENIVNGVRLWRNENALMSTKNLYKQFKNEKTVHL